MIIKNCPACRIAPSCCTEWNLLHCEWKDCENITDCVMKKIVDKCRDSKFYLQHYGHPENDGVKNYTLAKEILELLDIQEVE